MAQMLNVKDAKEFVLANYPNDPLLKHIAIALLDQLPKVEAVEVVHGRWEWKPIQNSHWMLTCSVFFGTKNASEDCNYCPNCGAKMDGG